MPRGRRAEASFFYDPASGSVVVRDSGGIRVLEQIGGAVKKKRKSATGKRLGRPPKAQSERKPRGARKKGDQAAKQAE